MIESNEHYTVEELTHSVPYVIPQAAKLIDDIGINFLDSLTNKGLNPYRIIITSVTRSQEQHVFDYMTDRCFFIKLMEVITGKQLDKAVCTKSRGEAPQQTMDFDEMEKKLTAGSDDLGEDFYGDQGYNSDEIDAEGYEGLDGIVGGDSYDGSDIY